MPTRLIKALQSINNFRRFSRSSQMWFNFVNWYPEHGKWIQRYRNIYSNQDCFLLCNGPSLNLIELSRLRNYHCIGLNKIYMLFDRINLDLTFHVAVNKLVIEQSRNEFRKLDCPSFLSYQTAKQYIKDAGNIHYLYCEHRAEPRFSRVYDEPIWEGYTVTYVALQLALFMGFRNVFIIGLDHSFQAKGKPNELQALETDDNNHFDSRYFSGCQWHLPDLEGSEVSYTMAKFAFERSERGVFDATIGGQCSIFQKLPIDEAFTRCKKRG